MPTWLHRGDEIYGLPDIENRGIKLPNDRLRVGRYLCEWQGLYVAIFGGNCEAISGWTKSDARLGAAISPCIERRSSAVAACFVAAENKDHADVPI
jgi:hypothetical protein